MLPDQVRPEASVPTKATRAGELSDDVRMVWEGEM